MRRTTLLRATAAPLTLNGSGKLHFSWLFPPTPGQPTHTGWVSTKSSGGILDGGRLRHSQIIGGKGLASSSSGARPAQVFWQLECGGTEHDEVYEVEVVSVWSGPCVLSGGGGGGAVDSLPGTLPELSHSTSGSTITSSLKQCQADNTIGH